MTNSSSPGGGHLPDPLRSDEPSIEIYLFHCGHGDTVLIRLPDDRWGLIDCFLPEQYGVRKRFFEFIDAKKIRTFHFIIQTHPDYDHYHGMQVVIEHFLNRGETIGSYIDTGLTARCARDLLQNRPGVEEYQALQACLERWDEAGQIKFFELKARYVPFFPLEFGKQIEFFPIAPNPDQQRRLMTADLRKLARRPDARLVANQLSLVVVLLVKINGRSLGVFLGADACTESVEWALDYWKQHTGKNGLAPEFDAIKIPHHGSINSHSHHLPKMKRSGSGTAVVSAGTRRAFPDREVLRAYLQAGWDVMSTTIRGKQPGANLPMTLAHRGRPDEDEGEPCRFSLHLSWSPSDGLRAEPAAAKVALDDLIHYETAAG